MMKSIWAVIICQLLLYSLAWAQSLDSIQAYLAPYASSKDPGFAIGVYQEGEVKLQQGYGLAHLEHEVPIQPYTVFRIASTSKQFTAACILLLAQEGKLQLEDPLSSFFPDFPPYADSITVRHLMHHTSGVRDYLMLTMLAGMAEEDYYTDVELMRWLVNQRELNFPPGSGYLYSNSGYWLLGQIVEQVSGQTLGEFARKHLFQPLGMHHTQYCEDPNRIVKHRAAGYTPSFTEDYQTSMTQLPIVGDGGVLTSVEDLLHWHREFMSHEMLGDGFWEAMLTSGQLNNGKSTGYAAGLILDTYKGLEVVSHGGAFVGFLAEMVHFPEKKLSVAVLANRTDLSPSRIALETAAIYLGLNKEADTPPQKDTVTPTAITLSSEQLEPFTGNYEMSEPVVLEMEVSLEADSLRILQLWNGIKYPVVPMAPNIFFLPSQPDIRFEFEKVQQVPSATVKVFQADQVFELSRKKDRPIDGERRQPKDYVGDYYSPELLVTYRIQQQGEEGDLSVWIKGQPEDKTPLQERQEDQFSAGFIELRFTRNLEGKVDAFRLDTGRAKNLLFIKQ